MSVAGKVAITLDPDVEWSAEKPYDKLVAVRYQNKLYISRKPSTNVLPTDNEYWMLAVSGSEVETMTNDVMGVAKPDNDTITVKDGVIKAEINKELLDKLGESDKGTLTFDGSEIKAISDYVFDTFEEAEAAVKAGLVEEGATVYVKEDSDSIPEMNGATADTDGRGGAVPAPKAGQENHVLKGNGAWEALAYDSELSAESENAPQTKVVEARAREIETNLAQLSNPNLLINPDFKINQRGGKIVTPGTTAYTDSTLGTVAGTMLQYSPIVEYTDTYGRYVYDGRSFYIKAEDVVDGYCENGKYTVDRWELFDYDARMWVKPKGSGGITLCLGKQSGNVFVYKYNHIEKDNIDIDMACKTGLTCSVSINGNICSVYFSGDDIKEKKQVGFWGEPFYTNDNAEVRIQFIPQWGDVIGFIGISMVGTPSNDVVIDIEWVKLELGSVATPFVPPDPASELLKCQRYLEKGRVCLRIGNITGSFNVLVNFATEKRICPTLTITNEILASCSFDLMRQYAIEETRGFDRIYTANSELQFVEVNFEWMADAELH